MMSVIRHDSMFEEMSETLAQVRYNNIHSSTWVRPSALLLGHFVKNAIYVGTMYLAFHLCLSDVAQTHIHSFIQYKAKTPTLIDVPQIRTRCWTTAITRPSIIIQQYKLEINPKNIKFCQKKSALWTSLLLSKWVFWSIMLL